MNVVDMADVVKTYGSVRALDGLTLSVRPAEIHGFLGPNGSGKTTALRVLLGFIRADSGSAHVLGLDPWADSAAVHQRLSYVPGEVSLWPTLTGAEVIELIGRVQGRQKPARVAELIDAFELDPTRKIRTYSKGNRQKVALVAALSADVELFLLDEPTVGLDPVKSAQFSQWARLLRAEGRTILLSSHILSEVQQLCDRVSILRAGHIVDSGAVDQLRHLGGTRIVARVSRPPGDLAHIAGVRSAQVTASGEVDVHLDESAMPEVLSTLVSAGVKHLNSQPPTLEDVFLQHYGTANSTDPAHSVGAASPSATGDGLQSWPGA